MSTTSSTAPPHEQKSSTKTHPFPLLTRIKTNIKTTSPDATQLSSSAPSKAYPSEFSPEMMFPHSPPKTSPTPLPSSSMENDSSSTASNSPFTTPHSSEILAIHPQLPSPNNFTHQQICHREKPVQNHVKTTRASYPRQSPNSTRHEKKLNPKEYYDRTPAVAKNPLSQAHNLQPHSPQSANSHCLTSSGFPRGVTRTKGNQFLYADSARRER